MYNKKYTISYNQMKEGYISDHDKHVIIAFPPDDIRLTNMNVTPVFCTAAIDLKFA